MLRYLELVLLYIAIVSQNIRLRWAIKSDAQYAICDSDIGTALALEVSGERNALVVRLVGGNGKVIHVAYL